MISVKEFEPDDLLKIRPLKEDHDYGLKLYKQYSEKFHGLDDLFTKGMFGLCTDEKLPMTEDDVQKVMASGLLCQPEYYSGLGEIPLCTGRNYLSCYIEPPRYLNKNHYVTVRVQGEVKDILMDDFPEEGYGLTAVAAMNTLALAGYTPFQRESDRPQFVLHAVRVNSMHKDDNHDDIWLAAEFDFYIAKRAKVTIPVPRNEDGYIDLDALRSISEREA